MAPFMSSVQLLMLGHSVCCCCRATCGRRVCVCVRTTSHMIARTIWNILQKYNLFDHISYDAKWSILGILCTPNECQVFTIIAERREALDSQNEAHERRARALNFCCRRCCCAVEFFPPKWDYTDSWPTADDIQLCWLMALCNGI